MPLPAGRSTVIAVDQEAGAPDSVFQPSDAAVPSVRYDQIVHLGATAYAGLKGYSFWFMPAASDSLRSSVPSTSFTFT